VNWLPSCNISVCVYEFWVIQNHWPQNDACWFVDGLCVKLSTVLISIRSVNILINSITNYLHGLEKLIVGKLFKINFSHSTGGQRSFTKVRRLDNNVIQKTLVHFKPLSSTPGAYNFCLIFTFFQYIFAFIPNLPHACYVNRPPHSPWFHHRYFADY
jgi:hypothetical protein